MAKLNMANMNTLFKKGYLLAGVMMAANMFIVNEVKAMENKVDPNANLENNIKEIKEEKPDVPGTNILDRLLSRKNIFNLIGEAVFSGFNNSFKWWDYNPGWYGQFGCFGWKSKRFLYDVVQFEFNCNLGRGALWSILHFINSKMKNTQGKNGKDNNSSWTSFFLKDILRGFTSMPLTFHIHKFNFSISFSLDSIIWMGIDIIQIRRMRKEGNQEINDKSLSNSIKGKDQNQQNNGPTTENIKLDDSKNENEESPKN